MAEKMLTLSEMERITGKSRTTIRAWCEEGKISYSKDGKRTLIAMSELFRVFPDVTGDDVQKKLKPNNPHILESTGENDSDKNGTSQNKQIQALLSRVHELEEKLSFTTLELEKSKFKSDLLEERVKELLEDKRNLSAQLEVKDRQFFAFDRLIATNAKTRRAANNPNQVRDSEGRFTKGEPPEGKGVSGLFQTSLVE